MQAQFKPSRSVTLFCCIQEDNPEYMEVARQLARSGEAAYRLLTDETPGFYDYYYETTVVNQIALMNMGSRPARRQVRDF